VLCLSLSSILAKSFSASSGTAMKIEGRSVLMSSPTVRRLSTKYMPQPLTSGTTKLAVNEKAWKSGSTTRKSSLAVIMSPMASKLPCASLQKLRWVSIAPLGLPVVPEV